MELHPLFRQQKKSWTLLCPNGINTFHSHLAFALQSPRRGSGAIAKSKRRKFSFTSPRASHGNLVSPKVTVIWASPKLLLLLLNVQISICKFLTMPLVIAVACLSPQKDTNKHIN